MINLEPERWVHLIAEAVQHIADREYQARSWFNRSDEVDSPDEAFSHLFDDLDFEEFLVPEGGAQLTPDQRLLGEALRDKLNEYASRTPQNLDPAEVFNDPDWAKIRGLADTFYRSLRTKAQK